MTRRIPPQANSHKASRPTSVLLSSGNHVHQGGHLPKHRERQESRWRGRCSWYVQGHHQAEGLLPTKMMKVRYYHRVQLKPSISQWQGKDMTKTESKEEVMEYNKDIDTVEIVKPTTVQEHWAVAITGNQRGGLRRKSAYWLQCVPPCWRSAKG